MNSYMENNLQKHTVRTFFSLFYFVLDPPEHTRSERSGFTPKPSLWLRQPLWKCTLDEKVSSLFARIFSLFRVHVCDALLSEGGNREFACLQHNTCAIEIWTSCPIPFSLSTHLKHHNHQQDCTILIYPPQRSTMGLGLSRFGLICLSSTQHDVLCPHPPSRHVM